MNNPGWASLHPNYALLCMERREVSYQACITSKGEVCYGVNCAPVNELPITPYTKVLCEAVLAVKGLVMAYFNNPTNENWWAASNAMKKAIGEQG